MKFEYSATLLAFWLFVASVQSIQFGNSDKRRTLNVLDEAKDNYNRKEKVKLQPKWGPKGAPIKEEKILKDDKADKLLKKEKKELTYEYLNRKKKEEEIGNLDKVEELLKKEKKDKYLNKEKKEKADKLMKKEKKDKVDKLLNKKKKDLKPKGKKAAKELQEPKKEKVVRKKVKEVLESEDFHMPERYNRHLLETEEEEEEEDVPVEDEDTYDEEDMLESVFAIEVINADKDNQYAIFYNIYGTVLCDETNDDCSSYDEIYAEIVDGQDEDMDMEDDEYMDMEDEYEDMEYDTEDIDED